MTTACILYGVPHSYYTAKARAYLIKQGIPFREVAPKTRHYVEDVLPAIQRRIIPVLELADGRLIQDSTEIIDHFENQPGIASALPQTPRQKIVALLLDAMGAEGLLRPAMHYRWDFPDANQTFLARAFATTLPSGDDTRPSEADARMDLMRQAAVNVGVAAEAVAVIESAYLDLLARMEAHLSRMPYLLGGRPCTGDFGMVAPFYAHLSRDPHPAMIMKTRAYSVYRWTERMNRNDADVGEFPEQAEAYVSDDEIPPTLKGVITLLAEDFVPETRAAAKCIDGWLESQNPASGATAKRAVGFATFEFRGLRLRAIAQPYRFYLLRKMQKAFEALSPSQQKEVRVLFEELGVAELLTLKLARDVLRDDNREVWA